MLWQPALTALPLFSCDEGRRSTGGPALLQAELVQMLGCTSVLQQQNAALVAALEEMQVGGRAIV